MTDDATTLPPLRAELFLNPAARRDEAYGLRRGAVSGSYMHLIDLAAEAA